MDPGLEPDALWISERLFWRLVHLARAYELHAVPMLVTPDRFVLDRARCAAVLDELEFVADRVDDAPTRTTVHLLVTYLATRLRRPGWDGPLTVDPD